VRTATRLKGLKDWAEKNLCQGREMKAPGPGGDITKVVRQTPRCYLGWYPARPDNSGFFAEPDPASVCPGILIMPRISYARKELEQRFDRYNKIKRNQDMGQTLSVDILFSVYEPGIRLPGFVEKYESTGQLDMKLLAEGTQEGLFTLFNWMDDCKEALLRDRHIEGTDLQVNDESIVYSLYSDQSYVVDKRPVYYGFVAVEFTCYADHPDQDRIGELLK